jgi:multidrug efflux pump subunit AcrB
VIDNSELLKGRIWLLLRNAAIGLLLVLLILACFLDLRLALWTTVGIPLSFLGAFILLPQADVGVNMISLFAFIVVLGIVVDDAIVVGENVFAYRQQPGVSSLDAAILGVKEMAGPVTMAILTTMAAFVPLLQGDGVWFQVLRNIPIVVISVLIISTIEAFLVLPSHLSAGRRGGRRGPVARFQRFVRHGLQWLIGAVYRPVLMAAVRWRYVTVASGASFLVMAGGLLGGGHLPVEFFPSVEADNMVVAVTMAQGTPPEKTAEVLTRIERAAYQVQREFEAKRADSAPPLFKHVATSLGAQPMTAEMGARGGGAVEIRAGGHLGEVNVVLLSGEDREVSTKDMIARWRELVGEITGATALDFAGTYFSTDAVHVELSHRDQRQLIEAMEALKARLATYEGLTEISDNFVEGKPQVEITGITPRGRAAGIRKEDVARQVRQALYGDEVQRVQRGRDEVKVLVRYPRDERSSLGDLENLRVRLEGGTEIPFGDVAEQRYGRDSAVIYRTDRRRTVAVVADVNKDVANAQVINDDLRDTVLPRLTQTYPGLTWDMEGEQRERNDAMGSLKSNLILALLVIYALLAVQFRSYIQPMIVMVAIPFGIVGAVLGHFAAPLLKMPFTGAYAVMPISFMSFFGIVALTGVVVNDALIMIDLINRERAAGSTLDEALEHSGTRRFRPILLTALATFFGLMPMIMEVGRQAQFLSPMAVSRGFGVMFATAITLLLVPSLYRVLEDCRALVGSPEVDGLPMSAEPPPTVSR